MKKFYYLFGAVAVLGIGIVGYNVGSGMFGSAVSAPIALDLSDDAQLVALAQGESLGDDNAPVTIVEFGDYSCPGCGAFALTVKPQIESDLIPGGGVKLVFYDYPLVSIHPNSFLAARASRCAADQGKYWEYQTTLFRNQARWASASMPSSAFEDYADEVGIDGGDFSSCLNSDRYADVVSANMQLGVRMSVNSTPTVFINAKGELRRMNQVDFQSLKDAIDKMTSPAPGTN